MTHPTASATRHGGRPADRYGRPGRWQRPAVISGVALLALAGVGWVTWAALYHADPLVSARVERFVVPSDGELVVTIRVERDAGSAVTCRLTAQASDYAVVGERDVDVPRGGRETVDRTFVVTTERRASRVVVDDCHLADSG